MPFIKNKRPFLPPLIKSKTPSPSRSASSGVVSSLWCPPPRSSAGPTSLLVLRVIPNPPLPRTSTRSFPKQGATSLSIASPEILGVLNSARPTLSSIQKLCNFVRHVTNGIALSRVIAADIALRRIPHRLTNIPKAHSILILTWPTLNKRRSNTRCYC